MLLPYTPLAAFDALPLEAFFAESPPADDDFFIDGFVADDPPNPPTPLFFDERECTAVSDGQHTGDEDETEGTGAGVYDEGKNLRTRKTHFTHHADTHTARTHLGLLVVFVGSDDSTRR